MIQGEIPWGPFVDDPAWVPDENKSYESLSHDTRRRFDRDGRFITSLFIIQVSGPFGSEGTENNKP